MALGPGSSELTPTWVDPPRVAARLQTVQRQFDRRARRFALHDAIVREVETRLVERFDLIRIDPARIVDVGCGRAGARDVLARRFPRARYLGVDLSTQMLRQAVQGLAGWDRLRALWRGQAADLVAADGAALPLADGCADLVVSNLMLHWHPHPHEVFPQFFRVLRVDGLLMFSCFGPDTLVELRRACRDAGFPAVPMPFIDMHDFGDMMTAAGFATPVMDAEKIMLTYATPEALLGEVRALGGNPRDDRGTTLIGAARMRALRDALHSRRRPDGRIGLTFEVAYGHAWKPAAKRRGESRIDVDQLRNELRRGR